jgi:hypothetical protein
MLVKRTSEEISAQALRAQVVANQVRVRVLLLEP